MTTLQPTPLNTRITSIDSLRGLALAGIIIVHMVEQFLAGMVPKDVETNLQVGILDYVVDGLIFLIFRGKFYALFAFLFGVSFYIQMDRAARKGKDFRGRFIWRLTILLIFGLIHNLFYRGDILTVYVSLGFFLPLFYRVPDKWLIGIAVVLFLGAGRYVSFLIFGSDNIFGGPQLSPESPYVLQYWNTLKSGSMLDVFKDNSTVGLMQKFDFQFGIFARGYQTFGFFLIGLWIGRIDLFNRFHEFKKPIMRVLWWSLGITLASLLIMIFLFSQLPQPVKLDSWLSMFALTFYDIHNISLTALMVCGFLLLFYKKEKSFLGIFASYGQTALTNYIIQSLIGTFIFYNWGLGLLGEVRNIYAFLLGFIVIGAQIVMSNWWIKRFKYGPLEWLWRCGTYFKKIGLVRN